MNKPVDFSTAKLLKEKGFNEMCSNYYNQALFEGKNPNWEGVFPKHSVFKRSDYHYNSKPNNNDLWFECSAPTIAEVVMWLYEKYGIWIYITPPSVTTWYYNIESISKYFNKEVKSGYESPKEAYEAAIKYSLTELIK